VRLEEADELTGGMIFALLEVNGKPWIQRSGANPKKPRGRSSKAGKRGKRRKGK